MQSVGVFFFAIKLSNGTKPIMSFYTVDDVNFLGSTYHPYTYAPKCCSCFTLQIHGKISLPFRLGTVPNANVL